MEEGEERGGDNKGQNGDVRAKKRGGGERGGEEARRSEGIKRRGEREREGETNQ